MFGFCRDPLVKQMYKLGYTLIPLPESGTAPLQCFGRQGKALFRLGTLGDLFVPGQYPMPVIEPNIDMADDFTQTKSSALDASLGLAVLQEWLGDDKPEVTAKFGRSSKFAFNLRGVKKDRISIKPLDDFLVTASLNIGGPTLRKLLDGDEVYVTIAVLKATAMAVAAASGILVEGKLDVPEIVGLGISGDASVKLHPEGASTVVFEATKPLVFGFQAVQLCFVDGAYRSLKVDRNDLQLMSNESLATPESSGETGWLCDRIGAGFPRFLPASS
jgi:hypothetical protein